MVTKLTEEEIIELRRLLKKVLPWYNHPEHAVAINTIPFNALLRKSIPERYSDIDKYYISRHKDRTVIIEFKRGFMPDEDGKQRKAFDGLCFKNIVVYCLHNQRLPWNVTPENITNFEIWQSGHCKEKGAGFPYKTINKWLSGETL